MALLPASAAFGLAVLIGAMVILHTGINLQRSPFQALVADLVPSRDRSLAVGSVTFQMCVGAIVFLMLGQILGMRPAFLIAPQPFSASRSPSRSACVNRRRRRRTIRAGDLPFARRCGVVGHPGRVPGMRPIFIASLLPAHLPDVHDVVRCTAPSGSVCVRKTSRRDSSPGRSAA
jgi:hypothetical protein